MSNKLRWILTITISVALMLVIFVKFYVFKNAETSVSSKKADIVMLAGELLKDFNTDENLANNKYLNKIITVKGLVDNIADNKTDVSVYLKLKDETSGVLCSFDRAEFKKSAIKAGTQVSIKGICSGYLMDVVLNKCALEN